MKSSSTPSSRGPMTSPLLYAIGRMYTSSRKPQRSTTCAQMSTSSSALCGSPMCMMCDGHLEPLEVLARAEEQHLARAPRSSCRGRPRRPPSRRGTRASLPAPCLLQRDNALLEVCVRGRHGIRVLSGRELQIIGRTPEAGQGSQTSADAVHPDAATSLSPKLVGLRHVDPPAGLRGTPAPSPPCRTAIASCLVDAVQLRVVADVLA